MGRCGDSDGGGNTEFEGIAKSGPFAAVAETTNNNTRPIAYIIVFLLFEVASISIVLVLFACSRFILNQLLGY